MLAATQPVQQAQFDRAIEAANLKDASGLYVLRPRWARQRMLMKFGLTKNVNARLWGSYRHSFPVASPGNSFELVAFLRVHPDWLTLREKALLRASIDGYGFKKPPFDLEWRTFVGDNRELMNTQLIKLLTTIRTTIDGNFYLFHHTTGEIIYKGGRAPSLQVSNILQNVPNVQTRAGARAGLRRTSTGLLVMDPNSGHMVPLVPGTARRLRNK